MDKIKGTYKSAHDLGGTAVGLRMIIDNPEPGCISQGLVRKIAPAGQFNRGSLTQGTCYKGVARAKKADRLVRTI